MRKPDTSLEELSRRKYIQAIAAITAAGAAGCSGESTPTEGGEPEETETTDELGVSGDTETDADTEEETETRTRPDSDPVATTLTAVVENVLDQANMSTWQTGDRAAGIIWMTEITGPRNQQFDKYLSDHTWETPWKYDFDEVEIPVVYEDYEIDPPYDVREWMDDRLTYWDGTPIDADGRFLHDYVQYGYDSLIFDEGESFNNEVVDQYTYHWWYQTEERQRDQLLNPNEPELDAEANPQNELSMERGGAGDMAVPGANPHQHPDFTEPYADRYMDATSDSEVNDITDELNGDQIPIERFADEGWGSGLYELESSENVSETSITLSLRDDHPNEHASIPELELQLATSDRAKVLRSDGRVDIDTGAVAERGAVNRETLPDHIQEIERWLQRGAETFTFNFNNKHLGRLWFRRALLAAVDWNMVVENSSGELAFPNPLHTGLLPTVSEQYFDEEFLDSLYTYPMEADTELATEWMQRAGYERDGDEWVGPDGDTPELDIMHRILDAYTRASQTMKSSLESFGIPVSVDVVNWDVFTQRAQPPDYEYDIMLIWSANRLINAYNTNGAWSEEPIISGDPEDAPYHEADADDEVDGLGRPIEAPIPTEVGSIDAPDGGYKVPPDLQDSETVNIIEAIDSLREPEISEDEIIERAKVCARYVNYYMPIMIPYQFYTGMYGNVRDFTFPEEGHPMYGVQKEFGSTEYSTLAGLHELKYDEDYPEP